MGNQWCNNPNSTSVVAMGKWLGRKPGLYLQKRPGYDGNVLPAFQPEGGSSIQVQMRPSTMICSIWRPASPASFAQCPCSLPDCDTRPMQQQSVGLCSLSSYLLSGNCCEQNNALNMTTVPDWAC